MNPNRGHHNRVDASYLALIHSSRVLPATRAVLLERMEESYENYHPQILIPSEMATLDAVVSRLIPEEDEASKLPLAAAIDHALATGKGNGWRYAEMPDDAAAMRCGLALLDASAGQAFGHEFCRLTAAQQDQLLTSAQNGDLNWHAFSSRLWFEETLALTTELFMASPETLNRMGYSGIANFPSWPRLGLDSTEPWEPQAK